MSFALRYERASSGRLWLAAALLVAVVTAAVFYHEPTASAAFYEYAGASLLDGKVLYRDLWDNKLPSIYYLNALWHVMFGSRYVLHWVAELTVLLATILLFAAFARRAGLAHWGPATAAFAILLSLPPLRHFNYTEPYAACLILLAFVAVQRRAPIAGGVLLGVAATFWLPALFQAAAVIAICRSRSDRIRFLAGLVASGAIFALIVLHAFGYSSIAAGLREMYGWGEDLHPQGSLLGVEARRVWSTLNATALLVPIVLLLGLLRLPSGSRERFALVWAACALGGAAISLRFSAHEFLPAVAAVVFALAAYLEAPRWSPARRVVIAVLALALLLHAPKLLAHVRADIAEEMQDARNSAVVGRVLASALPRESGIVVYGYASGIYLSARRSAAGRYPNHSDSGLLTASERARQAEYLAGVGRADAVVAARHATLFPSLEELVLSRFMPGCLVGSTGFRVYLRRSLMAKAPSDGPSRQALCVRGPSPSGRLHRPSGLDRSPVEVSATVPLRSLKGVSSCGLYPCRSLLRSRY